MQMPPSIRRAAERFSRGRVLKRRLPADLGAGPLFVTPDAALRYWLPTVGMVDSGLLDAVRELIEDGDVVWDIGANVGLFTYASAYKVGSTGKVVAIEPDPFLASILARTRVAARNCGHVEIFAGAVAGTTGLARLSISARGRAANHLDGFGHDQTGGSRGQIVVTTTTVDALGETLPAPTFIKIDVEGAEVHVLRGAQGVLRKSRPRILMEVSDACSADVTKLLLDADYTIYDGSTAKADRTPLSRAVWNTLALPK